MWGFDMSLCCLPFVYWLTWISSCHLYVAKHKPYWSRMSPKVCIYLIFILKIQKGKVSPRVQCSLKVHSSPQESIVWAPQGFARSHSSDLWLLQVQKKSLLGPGPCHWQEFCLSRGLSSLPVSVQVWLPDYGSGPSPPITCQETQWRHQPPIRGPDLHEQIMLPHWVDRISARGKNSWHFLSWTASSSPNVHLMDITAQQQPYVYSHKAPKFQIYS